MQLDEAIYGRRAVRDYTSEPLDRAAMRRLIDAAIQAPSAVNAQPWAFTVVQDRPLLDRVSRDAKAHMLATMPAALRQPHLLAMLNDPDFQIFYHAPALILISASAPGPFATEDCALAAENLMLAAHASGLGSCWIGFAQSWLGTPAGKEALGLPAEQVPVAPIIVGHPRSPAPHVARKQAQIHWIG